MTKKRSFFNKYENVEKVKKTKKHDFARKRQDPRAYYEK